MYEQIVDLDICKSSKIIDISQNPRHSLGIFDIRNDDESLIGPTVLINRLINLKNVSKILKFIFSFVLTIL